ncbi:MAG: hypothetical protein EI684_01755 [Candidatus Viridilinea halotolerans]|uniref:Uncharacterized protein n=1 Tax=Candidatus Viridilinea halotolerans TaxID=2491704 RepID=A0A426UA72_9CHLR|nr:MAG: hypothetical protein EI684_01755 [Candidatus Viridilinea halotolerans]
MAVTYTNRRGVTFYLCQSLTKTGKPRYYFAREPKGRAIEQIPDGFRVGENANGLVWLERERPALLLADEIAIVEAAIARHPQSRNYHVGVKHDQIIISERAAAGTDDLVAKILGSLGVPPGGSVRLRSDVEARGTPVLRFSLIDAERRRFIVKRWCFKGRIDDWIDVGLDGPLAQIVAPAVARLGTDDFFEFFWSAEA